MPGLSQLKQFNKDILALGDELKIRTARGEKPVRVPIPKDVEDRDDSEDFANGMPEISEDEIAQAEAAASEREKEKYDFSAITGESSSSDSKAPVQEAPVILPDVSDILNTAAEIDLDDTDLSEFEEPEPEPEPEPEETPIEDMDLDSLLQFSETPAEDEVISDDSDGFSDFDDIEQNDTASESAEDVEAAQAEAARLDDFNSKLDAMSENNPPEQSDFNMEDAAKDFGEVAEDGTFETIDFSSDLPDELQEPDEEEDSSESGIDLDNVVDEAEAAPATESFDMSDMPVDIADMTLPSEESLAAAGSTDFGLGDLPDLGDMASLGDDIPDVQDTDISTENLDFDTSGLDSMPDMDSLTGMDSLPDIGSFGETEIPASSDGIPSTDDFSSINDSSVTENSPVADTGLDELSNFDIDSIGSSDMSEPAPAIDSFETKETPAMDFSATDTGLDDLGSFDIDSIGSSDMGSSDTGVVDSIPTEDLTSMPAFDTSGMDLDDSDFSAPAGGSEFEFGNITSIEGDDFAIPGFSDTLTANLNKHKEAPAASSVPGAATDDSSKPDKEKNTFTDAEYKLFLENLEHYPLNVRIALEDFVVKNEFTDDAVFEVLEKILRKVPARQVAADLEKKLDISIPVPRDFEHRTAEEYEAYKQSIEYQLKNRIIPGVILTTFATVLIVCIYILTNAFVYKPIRAHNFYKQGYALIQQNEYPLSEDKFNNALYYKTVKAWFFKYARRYREHKQYERARNMYNQILRRFNHDKTAGLEWAGMELHDLYNYEESERILKREVLDYYINDPDAILQLGDLYLDWATEKDPSKFELAKQQYDLLMNLYGEKKKDVPTYLARQMRYYIRTDNLALVLQYKQNYFPQNKNLGNDDLVELSGYLLNKRYGNLPLSEENLRSHIEGLRGMLEEAVKRAPENPMALYNMGLYFVKTNSGKKGIALFQRAIEVFKGQQYRSRRDTYRYIDTYRLLGEEYIAEREHLLAEQAYQQGIEIFEKENNSSGFESTADVGKLYSDMGDIDYFISGDMDTALRNYIKAVNGKNDTSSIRYRIGYIQYKNRNYPEALGSFIRSAEGSPNDTHVLLALANTLSLRDDNYAAQGYYEKLLNVLEVQRQLHDVLLPQVREDQADIVNTYMKASNNLGVTLSRIAQLTGDSKMNAHAIVSLQDSLRAWDALTRNPETMIRLEGSNLAAQNIKYLTEPYSEYEPGIYTEIPNIINDEEGLE